MGWLGEPTHFQSTLFHRDVHFWGRRRIEPASLCQLDYNQYGAAIFEKVSACSWKPFFPFL